MHDIYDRRAFLRRLGAVWLVAPTVPILGCGGEGAPAPDAAGLASGEGQRSITRPILLPWSTGTVRIAAPMDEVPMAYVSMGLRQVFVDYAFRDRSNWVLDAHISVSTGVWRIPLPGDPVGQPIQPGDTPREFEELDIVEWDPEMEPAEGDFRVRRGRRENIHVDFDCVPMAGSEGRFSGGPWEITQCGGQGDELCREDFTHIGTGSRYRRRALGTCTEPIGEVRYMTWASLD